MRINDRGPATPHRLLEVTRRTATLLGFPADGVARVRLEVLPTDKPGGGRCGARRTQLADRAAPRGDGDSRAICRRPAALPPRPRGGPPLQPSDAAVRAATADCGCRRSLTQVAPDPGHLYVQLSSFQSYQYAAMQRARVAGLGARWSAVRE